MQIAINTGNILSWNETKILKVNPKWKLILFWEKQASQVTFVSSIQVASSDILESILEWAKLVLDLGNFFTRCVGF